MNGLALRRSVAARVSSVILGVGAALLLSEGAIRLCAVAPEVSWVEWGRYRLSANPLIGYEPIPSFFRYELDANPLAHDNLDYRSSESNRLGFRDREHPLEPAPGVTRVLVLGDSVTMGIGIDRRDDLYTSVAERSLGSEGRAFELLNFGVVGYNTQQEVETLREKGLAYDPDVVVLSYCLNDRGRSDGWLMGALLHSARQSGAVDPTRTPAWLRWSALYRFLRFRVLAPTQAEEQALVDARHREVSEDRVEAYFALLADLAAAHSFRVLVAIFPTFGDASGEGDRRQHPFPEEHAAIAALAESKGFAVLDLLPTFVRCETEGGRALSYDRYHPTVDGHACAGRALATALGALR